MRERIVLENMAAADAASKESFVTVHEAFFLSALFD